MLDNVIVANEAIKVLEYMALNERGMSCLREVFENFSRFNKILCVNPEYESS